MDAKQEGSKLASGGDNVSMPTIDPAPSGTSAQVPKLSCTKCFDALWFCYSPFHQMQHYYRYGDFDNCFGKWSALYDCLSLKTKRASEVQEILETREKKKQHIWTYRTVEESSAHWWKMYQHLLEQPPEPEA